MQGKYLRQIGRHQGAGIGPSLDLRIAVDDDVADVGQQARRPVASAMELEKLRRLVDKARGRLAALEVRRLQHPDRAAPPAPP